MAVRWPVNGCFESTPCGWAERSGRAGGGRRRARHCCLRAMSGFEGMSTQSAEAALAIARKEMAAARGAVAKHIDGIKEEKAVKGVQVDEDHAVHTALDPEIYGADEIWNQQMFTGGSPAELLKRACKNAIDPSVLKLRSVGRVFQSAKGTAHPP